MKRVAVFYIFINLFNGIQSVKISHTIEPLESLPYIDSCE